jgi:phage terminase small subunit
VIVLAGRNVPVAAPEDLHPDARALWEEIVAVLAEHGIIDRIDLPMLRQLCTQYARAREAARIVDAPLSEEEEERLEKELHESTALADALKLQIANRIRSSVEVPPSQVNALANYETAILNKRAYLDARRKVGGLVALGSTGQLVENPLVGLERAAASLVLRFASDFALTPTARAALGIRILEGRKLHDELADDLGPQARRTPVAAIEQKSSSSKPKRKTKKK